MIEETVSTVVLEFCPEKVYRRGVGLGRPRAWRSTSSPASTWTSTRARASVENPYELADELARGRWRRTRRRRPRSAPTTCASSSGRSCCASSTRAGWTTCSRWTTSRRASACARSAQVDPLVEYKTEAYEMFGNLVAPSTRTSCARSCTSRCCPESAPRHAGRSDVSYSAPDRAEHLRRRGAGRRAAPRSSGPSPEAIAQAAAIGGHGRAPATVVKDKADPYAERGPQRPVPVRQRQEVQEVPRGERVAMTEDRSTEIHVVRERVERIGEYLHLDEKRAEVEQRSRPKAAEPGFWDDQAAAQATMTKAAELRDEIDTYESIRAELDDARGAATSSRSPRTTRTTAEDLGALAQGALEAHRRPRAGELVHRRVRPRRRDRHHHPRRGRAREPGLGRDAAAHADEVRRAPEVEGRPARRPAGRGGRHRARGVHGARPQRVRHAAVRAGRAPPRAHHADRREEAPPHDVREASTCCRCCRTRSPSRSATRTCAIDVYRSSGPGGQSVNTTDSAVRITHIPTGIVVTCQNEKSQLKNKDAAMKILRSRLYELEKAKREAEIEELRGEKRDICFGSQIRNYVLYPYQMVKDVRTGVETGNVDRRARRRARRLRRRLPPLARERRLRKPRWPGRCGCWPTCTPTPSRPGHAFSTVTELAALPPSAASSSSPSPTTVRACRADRTSGTSRTSSWCRRCSSGVRMLRGIEANVTEVGRPRPARRGPRAARLRRRRASTPASAGKARAARI